MHRQHCYFVELGTLMCGVTSPLLLKKIYQISPWNKNLVSSHTYIYKGKIMNSSDLLIIFSLLVLLLFWYVNILYRKINLQVYILNLLFLKHQNQKKINMNCAFSLVTSICSLIFLAGGECVVVY